ncbi:MAG TPA: permease prefix domain 1-containing protein [Gemmatimonadaceae bacterium]|jgi:hypothetical protein|nr:permease prefix domain 1-containing protein [Gemmatimonadaceae bacterium]
MNFPSIVPRWRRYPRFWRPDVQRDVDDELRFHLEMRLEELTAEGMGEADARTQALGEFGDVVAVRPGFVTIDHRPHRRRARSERLRDAMSDLSYTVRTPRRCIAFPAKCASEALGGRMSDLVRLVLGGGVPIVVVGVAVGIVLALVSGRFISSVLYGVRASDPAAIASVAAVLLLVAVVASLVPAWRAARLDPVNALRSDSSSSAARQAVPTTRIMEGWRRACAVASAWRYSTGPLSPGSRIRRMSGIGAPPCFTNWS